MKIIIYANIIFMKILVTGSPDYVGRYLINYLFNFNKCQITALTRDSNFSFSNNNINIYHCKFFFSLNFDYILKKTDIIINLISKQHCKSSSKSKLHNEYFHTNVNITKRLLEKSKKYNIKKIIFLSTIKVLGEHTKDNNKFNIYTKPNPKNFYSKTKLLDENIIIQNSENIFYTILRIPLVYGSKEKGNLNKLTKLIKLGAPLPFNNINNKRSLIHIWNLCIFIEKCIFLKNQIIKFFYCQLIKMFQQQILLKF